MSAARNSVYYFSFYLIIAGAGLFFMPNTILHVLGTPATNEAWIRVAGTLTLILGLFFVTMARQNNQAFVRATLLGRGTFILAMIVIIVAFHGPAVLWLFAGVDAIGFSWTWIALRREKRQPNVIVTSRL